MDAPIYRATKEAGNLFSIAVKVTNDLELVSIGRPADPNDTYYADRDEYGAWTNVLNHPQLDEIVTMASTNLDDYLTAYLSQNVFWVKHGPEDHHHMTEEQLPPRFPAIFLPDEEEET